VIECLLQEAEKREYVKVFQEIGGAEYPFRLQSHYLPRTSAEKHLRKNIMEIVTCFDEGWSANSFTFMKSLPGGQDQEPHQDFTDKDRVETQEKHPGHHQASMVIALLPNTKLRVFEGCFLSQDPRKSRVIEIPVGMAIIFRDDLIHSGVGYDSLNYRVHCYLTLDGIQWTPDVVMSVQPKLFSCQFCELKDDNANRMRQHRYNCRQNPKGAWTKQRDKQECSCLVCDKIFNSRSALRMHNLRHHK
jgi:hypothetical protein